MWGVVCTAAFHCVLVTLINKWTVTFTGGPYPAVVTGSCRDTFVVFGAYKFYMNQKCNVATKKVDTMSRCVNSKGGNRQFEVVIHSHRSEVRAGTSVASAKVQRALEHYYCDPESSVWGWSAEVRRRSAVRTACAGRKMGLLLTAWLRSEQ